MVCSLCVFGFEQKILRDTSTTQYMTLVDDLGPDQGNIQPTDLTTTQALPANR